MAGKAHSETLDATSSRYIYIWYLYLYTYIYIYIFLFLYILSKYGTLWLITLAGCGLYPWLVGQLRSNVNPLKWLGWTNLNTQEGISSELRGMARKILREAYHHTKNPRHKSPVSSFPCVLFGRWSTLYHHVVQTFLDVEVSSNRCTSHYPCIDDLLINQPCGDTPMAWKPPHL